MVRRLVSLRTVGFAATAARWGFGYRPPATTHIPNCNAQGERAFRYHGVKASRQARRELAGLADATLTTRQGKRRGSQERCLLPSIAALPRASGTPTSIARACQGPLLGGGESLK